MQRANFSQSSQDNQPSFPTSLFRTVHTLTRRRQLSTITNSRRPQPALQANTSRHQFRPTLCLPQQHITIRTRSTQGHRPQRQRRPTTRKEFQPTLHTSTTTITQRLSPHPQTFSQVKLQQLFPTFIKILPILLQEQFPQASRQRHTIITNGANNGRHTVTKTF